MRPACRRNISQEPSILYLSNFLQRPGLCREIKQVEDFSNCHDIENQHTEA